jgi:hypothetical protein
MRVRRSHRIAVDAVVRIRFPRRRSIVSSMPNMSGPLTAQWRDKLARVELSAER